MNVTIKSVGYVQCVSALKALGEAGRAVSGPFLNFGSRLPYARPIETNEFLSGPRKGKPARRAGPARMFAQGIAELMPEIPQVIGTALAKGAASVGQAKRKLRDDGIKKIQAHTPVRSGDLRGSVQELTRPS
jgi:hypothetical protein